MAMDEETKKKLDEMARRKRGTLLKDLTITDLLVACDHWEEYGKMPKEWDGSLEVAMTGPDMGKVRFVAGACYLKYAKQEQVAALEQRLPHRRILLEVSYRAAQQLKQPIANSRGITCRIVTAFPVAAIEHILKFLTVKEPAKYRRRLDYNLDYYDPAP